MPVWAAVPRLLCPRVGKCEPQDDRVPEEPEVSHVFPGQAPLPGRACAL